MASCRAARIPTPTWRSASARVSSCRASAASRANRPARSRPFVAKASPGSAGGGALVAPGDGQIALGLALGSGAQLDGRDRKRDDVVPAADPNRQRAANALAGLQALQVARPFHRRVIHGEDDVARLEAG